MRRLMREGETCIQDHRGCIEDVVRRVQIVEGDDVSTREGLKEKTRKGQNKTEGKK